MIPSFPITLTLMMNAQYSTNHENNGCSAGSLAPMRFSKSLLLVRRIP